MNGQVMQLLNEAESDIVWFKDNLEELKESHNNQFIAIKNCEMVDSNEDVKKLLLALKKKRINAREVLIQFVSKMPCIF